MTPVSVPSPSFPPSSAFSPLSISFFRQPLQHAIHSHSRASYLDLMYISGPAIYPLGHRIPLPALPLPSTIAMALVFCIWGCLHYLGECRLFAWRAPVAGPNWMCTGSSIFHCQFRAALKLIDLVAQSVDLPPQCFNRALMCRLLLVHLIS